MKNTKVKKLIAEKKIDLKQIIDVRTPQEYRQINIKGSQNIEMNKLLANPAKYLNKKEKYYLICQSGARSMSTKITLFFKGYKVKNIGGGMLAWNAKNI